MKRILSIMILLFTAALCNAVEYSLPYSVSSVSVDGTIGAAEWDDALEIPFYYPDIASTVNNAPLSDSDLSADIYVKWDQQYLYIVARVYDDNLQWLQSAPGPFNSQDAFQVCLNPYDDAASVIFENAPIYDIVPQDSGSNGPQLYKHEGSGMTLPGALLAGQVLADGYIVEIAMPWSELGITPVAAQMHGIGFIVVDYDGGSSADTLLYDFNGGITVITNWNTARLIAENGCGENGVYPADFNNDCKVNLEDFAVLAENWMVCTDPEIIDCVNLN
ncbi:MAG: sugar-binding protein [Sedimentisphaeraceae bacterium JB056]